MRKRTIKFGLDNIFWYIIYLLPIIITVVQCIGIFKNFTFDDWSFISDNTSYIDYPFGTLFMNVLDGMGFGDPYSYFISDTLADIFGPFGIFPIITEGNDLAILCYMRYFVGCVLIHLFVDFILFIPRLAHKWMNTFTQTED